MICTCKRAVLLCSSLRAAGSPPHLAGADTQVYLRWHGHSPDLIRLPEGVIRVEYPLPKMLGTRRGSHLMLLVWGYLCAQSLYCCAIYWECHQSWFTFSCCVWYILWSKATYGGKGSFSLNSMSVCHWGMSGQKVRQKPWRKLPPSLPISACSAFFLSIFNLFIYFYLMCMGILPAWMSVWHMHGEPAESRRTQQMH